MSRQLAARLIFLCAVCLPVAAQQALQEPWMPQTQEERQFIVAVQRAIYEIMPQEQGHFVLNLAKRGNPMFPGEGGTSVEQAPCETLAAFHVIGQANELGTISAALCKNGSRVRELSVQSRARLAATLKMLPIVKEEDARKAGLYYELENLSDGSEFHYFPVLVIGHGVLIVFSGTIYDKKSGMAAVVQADPSSMCDTFRKGYEKSPFCTDLRGTLKRLARATQAAK